MQILCFSFAFFCLFFFFTFLPHRYVYRESRSKPVFLDKSKLHSNRSYIYIDDWDKKCFVYSLCNSTSEKIALLSCSNQTAAQQGIHKATLQFGT